MVHGQFGSGRKFCWNPQVLEDFEMLQKGAKRGYFPEPSKLSLLCRSTTRLQPRLPSKILASLLSRGLLPGRLLIGLAEDQPDWVKSKMSDWAAAIHELSLVATHYPQWAYAGLQKSLQQEWQFLQRVTGELGGEFHRGGRSSLYVFCAASPLWCPRHQTNITLWQLGCLPVKKSGL
jgi:hypothetical protein